MNPKNTFMLVALVAVLCAFIFYVEPRLHTPLPGPVKVLPDLKPGAVTSLQLLLAGNKPICAQRTNDGWQLTEPLPYPAQSQAIESLVRTAALLIPQTRISAQELKGRLTWREEFGFDNPQATLIFQQGADQFRLQLGFLTMPGDQIYAQVVGQADIDIIDADFFKKLIPHQANDWRDTSFVTLTNVPFDRLTVTAASQWFELRRIQASEAWHMTNPVQSRADNPKIDDLFLGLQKLHVTRFVTDDSHADLESFGLQPAALELRFDQGTNHSLSLQFGKSPTNDESLVYARRNGQSTIVLVPRERVSAWSAGFQEFRDRHLVRFDGGPPDLIEMAGPQENFTVQLQPDKTWRVTKPLDLPADTNVMRSFLDGLAGLEVVRFKNDVAVDDAAPPDSPAYGLAKPVRRYLLKHNASHEKAGNSNDVMAELDFGLMTNGNIFVRRADRPEESSVYAVKAEDFAKLPATALDLRTRRIWNFSPDDVTRITIRQKGKSLQMLHNGTGHWPIAVGSIGMNNELEVETGADELGLLEAQNWIERGDQNRARYGFSDQSLQIAAEVKAGGKPQTLTLDIGGMSPRGLRYGEVRMEDGQNWIFELPAVTMDRLTEYFNIKENPGP
ncbi:MAG: hypothetical protein JWQ04_2933 [Pedosphaera sp.]|nr:hypothetical protein [Pedosphaera sp.]